MSIERELSMTISTGPAIPSACSSIIAILAIYSLFDSIQCRFFFSKVAFALLKGSYSLGPRKEIQPSAGSADWGKVSQVNPFRVVQQ